MKRTFLGLKKRLRFLRDVENFISNIPVGIIQIFYIFSSKYILRSKFLNSLGFQIFRIRLADYLLERRQKNLISRTHHENKIKAEYLKKLKEEGVLEVKNVLPTEIFDKLHNIIESIKKDKTEYKHFVKAGAEYREVVVKTVDPELFDYLTRNFWVKELAKSYLGKKKVKMEWRIKLIRDYDGTFDNNTLWHADTFFNTLKAFIYLNDVDSSKDVYNYVLGSHVMTPAILDLHYRYSKNNLKQPWPDKTEIERLNLPKFHKSIQSNTLVLSDTRGLHRRRPKDQADRLWRSTLFCSFRSSPFTS